MTENYTDSHNFVSGENVYFEYLGTTSDVNVEVELNGLEEDYPISRVIKKDIYGDVVVQQMQQSLDHSTLGSIENSNDTHGDNEFIPAGCSCVEHTSNHYESGTQANCLNFHDEREHNKAHHSVHHLPASIEKQSDIIRDQINRSVKSSLDCNLEYDDDVTDVKRFWSDLPFGKKKEICKIESSEVLKVIQEDPKASCNCRVCGNRKMTLEKELQKLYIGYYAVRKLASESLDECELNINLINTMFGVPLIKASENSAKIEPADNSPIDSVMSVANDLVKNNGENFINLLEQLHHANRELSEVSSDQNTEERSTFTNSVSKSHPEDQIENLFIADSTENATKIEQLDDDYQENLQETQSNDYKDIKALKIEERDNTGVGMEDENYYDYEENDGEDTEELNDSYNNENDQATRRRLEETYKMLQLITSRVLRKKVYEAYKAKKADDISKSLLDEFAKEEAKLKEKEERLKRKKEKEKERKRLQRIAKEEEKKRLQDEKLEMERVEKEKQLKKMEEGRKRKEAERKKREEEQKRKQEGKRRKKEAELERQRIEKGEKEKQKLEEKKRREEESQRKDKEENERKNFEESEKKVENGDGIIGNTMNEMITNGFAQTKTVDIPNIMSNQNNMFLDHVTKEQSPFEASKCKDQTPPFSEAPTTSTPFQNKPISSISNSYLPFPEQANMLNAMDSVFSPLPQSSRSYPFAPQAALDTNTASPHKTFNSSNNLPNWGLNNINTLNEYSMGQQPNQQNMFTNSSMMPNMFNNEHNLFSNLPNSSTTNTPSSAPLPLKGKINTQTPPIRKHSESLLSDIFNPLNTRSSPPSMLSDDIFKASSPTDNYQNSNFWNNGPLLSSFNPQSQQQTRLNDLNTLPNSQGSIWGRNNFSSESQWNQQYNNNISQMQLTNNTNIEIIQSEALKVSSMLPKLLNGGYSLDLMYRYAKPYIETKMMHITLPQFVEALTTDSSKFNVKFIINKDELNDLFVSIISHNIPINPLNEFAGLSLQEDYKLGFRSGKFHSGNMQSSQSGWPQFN